METEVSEIWRKYDSEKLPHSNSDQIKENETFTIHVLRMGELETQNFVGKLEGKNTWEINI